MRSGRLKRSALDTLVSLCRKTLVAIKTQAGLCRFFTAMLGHFMQQKPPHRLRLIIRGHQLISDRVPS